MSLPRIIVPGAGLGGTIAAYDIREAATGRADVIVVSDTDDYWFIPSNPWVAMRWHEPDAIRVHPPPVMKKRGIGFTKVGCTRVHPTENRLDLGDGSMMLYDYLVTAVAHNLVSELDGKDPCEIPSWNAVCLADFGDGGVAFVPQPQIPPRNVNWASQGKWVHLAKVGFEKYFIHKVRTGTSEPLYEKLALQVLGINKLKQTTKGAA